MIRPQPRKPRPEPQEAGITAYLVERLGNQLFTYAAALAQARRLDVPLYGNLSYYHRRRSRTDRPYGLAGFDHGMTLDLDRRTGRGLVLGHPDVPLARPWYGVVRPRLRPRAAWVYVEGGFDYEPEITQVVPGTTLLGYFQSWRYFADVHDELRKRISSLAAPSRWYEETVREIRRTPGSIVLNLRRGDYLRPDLQAVHGLATRSYYVRALEVLDQLHLTGPRFVVSDDLGQAMRELEGLDRLRPLASPRGTDPLETMVAISHADAFVMANSSFSWWAAWLGDRPDRPVIGPRPWFTAPAVTARDLLLPHWLTLEARDLDRHS